jgi:hypothetical protein
MLERSDTRLKEPPSYSFIEIDSSINEQELLLQQCSQKNELNWSALVFRWLEFPFSLDYLMKLVRVYHQPLKLLATISNGSLFRILETLKKHRFPEEVEKIVAGIREDKENLALKHVRYNVQCSYITLFSLEKLLQNVKFFCQLCVGFC